MHSTKYLRTLIFVTLFFPFLMMTGCIKHTEKSQLTVMSYNIAAGYGDVTAIAKVISEADPDVVGLQEVDVNWGERSDFVDQAEYLGKSLNMNTFFAEIYSVDPDSSHLPSRKYGLAFLSKHDFVSTKNHTLSRLSTQTDPPELVQLPGFAEISIEIDGQIIRFFNTHLDFRRDPSVRIRQIQEMLDIMGSLEDPIVLMGDLNAQPQSEELALILEVFSDSWTDINDPGYTFPAEAPIRRIDYILHTKSVSSSTTKVLPVANSDHAPIITTLLF